MILTAGKVQKITATKDIGSGKISKTVTTFGADSSYAFPSETSTEFNTTDANGQPVKQTEKKTMTYYIGTGQLKEVTDGSNHKTSYSYDALGRLLEAIEQYEDLF